MHEDSCASVPTFQRSFAISLTCITRGVRGLTWTSALGINLSRGSENIAAPTITVPVATCSSTLCPTGLGAELPSYTSDVTQSTWAILLQSGTGCNSGTSPWSLVELVWICSGAPGIRIWPSVSHMPNLENDNCVMILPFPGDSVVSSFLTYLVKRQHFLQLRFSKGPEGVRHPAPMEVPQILQGQK